MERSPLFNYIDLFETYTINKKEYVFLHNGAISKIVRLQGHNDRNMSYEQRESFYYKMGQALSEITSHDIHIQILYTRRARNLNFEMKSDKVSRETRERIKFYNNLSKKGIIKENEILLAITMSPKRRGHGLIKDIKNTFKDVSSFIFSKPNRDLLNDRLEDTSSRINEIEKTWRELRIFFKDSSIKTTEINTRDELIEIYRSRIALSRAVYNEKFDINKDVSLRAGLCEGVLATKYDKYCILDDKLIMTFTLDSVESQRIVQSNAIDNLLDINFDMAYSVNMGLVSSEDAQKEVIDSIISSRNDSATIKGEVNEIAQAEIERKRDTNRQLGENGAQMLRASFNLAIIVDYATIKARAEKSMTSVHEIVHSIEKELHTRHFGKIAQSKWVSYFGQSLPLYLKMLPGLSESTHIYMEGRLDFSHNVAWMTGLFDNSRPEISHYGNNHFLNQDNTIFPYLHIDQKTLPSWTAKLAGSMGSGKSVLAGVLNSMGDYAAEISGKPALVRNFIFEGAAGSGFKRSALDSKHATVEHFTFNSSKKPKLSLFSLQERSARPKVSKREKLYQILEEMPELSSESRKKLSERINDYYDKLSSYEGNLNDEVRSNFLHKYFNKINPSTVIDGQSILEHFKLKVGEMIPDADNYMMIISNVTYMTSEQVDGKTLRFKFSRDNIKAIVDLTYERIDKRFPIISDLIDTIDMIIEKESRKDKNDENKSFTSVLFQMKAALKDWTSEGAYPYFDSEDTANLDADKITYDLYGLDPEKDLRLFKIYLTVIAQRSIEDMYKDMTRTKLLFIDEDWYFKQADETLCEVFYVIQKASRKYGFFCLSGSQQILEDLKALKKGKEMLDGYRQFIICGLNSSDRVDFLQFLDLGYSIDHLLDQLGQKEEEINGETLIYYNVLFCMKNKKDKWEFHLVKNLISPYELQVNSSNKDENAIIKYLINERSMDVEQAIDEIIDNYTDLRVDKDLHEYLRQQNNIETLEKLKRNKKLI